MLFTIPRSAIICTATSELPGKIPEVFDLDKDDIDQSDSGDDTADHTLSQDSWTLLILVMIYEHLRGSSSPWRPYLDVLPANFDTPMFWAPMELSELQASALTGKVGRAEADLMIQSKVLSVIRAHEQIFFPGGSPRLNDAQLLELAHRMGSTIMAYAFDLEKDDENDEADEDEEWVEDKEGRTMLGMVPMADILNADAEFNAHINHGDDALTATALRPIKAGEEILNYYGPLPNGELLRRYGYVTLQHSRYDVVELPWELVMAELQSHVWTSLSAADWKKIRELVQEDDEFEESFVLERYSEDPEPTGQLSSKAVFRGLPDELAEQFKACLKAATKVGNAELVAQALSDKEMRKGLYLQTIFAALRTREKQYPTSLEQDEQLLDGTSLAGRQRMAVWVRRGEKQLLREAQSWARKELDELEHNASGRRHGGDAPAAKRRRV